jgi:phosphatidylserine decarboxylase
MIKFLLLLASFVPKNLVSWIVGCAARSRLLGPLLKAVFLNIYELNLAEAELPAAQYPTLEALFTRALKPGARRVTGPLCSPADGYLARSEAVRAGRAVQAKGLDYDLAAFIFGSDPAPAGFSPVWFQTVYLAPHNYHRVHAPVTGDCTAVRYIPGQLWPVNQPAVNGVPRLFARNERLAFDFTLPGGGRVWAVMVGALNVGRMVTPLLPDLVTNGAGRQVSWRQTEHRLSPPRRLNAGDEIGTFMLGSTVIMVFDQAAMAALKPVATADHQPILMGQPLGNA